MVQRAAHVSHSRMASIRDRIAAMRKSRMPAAPVAPAEPEVQEDEMRGDAAHKHPEPTYAPKTRAVKPQKGAYGGPRVRVH